VRDGLFDSFRSGGSKFNNVLWTMRIELLGSLLLYAVYGFPPPRYRVAILAVLGAVLLPRPEFASFCYGALLREAFESRPMRAPAWQSWTIFVLALCVGSTMPGFADRMGLPHLPRLLALGEPHAIPAVAAAVGLVFAVKANKSLAAAFSSQLLVWAGTISFGLYLVHVPFLYTLFVPLFLSWHASTLGLCALFALFFIAALLAGTAFTFAIDRPVLALIAASRRAWMHWLTRSRLHNEAPA
jgi:peptidoglycan/LPS O-acetylase OafA/YrhL